MHSHSLPTLACTCGLLAALCRPSHPHHCNTCQQHPLPPQDAQGTIPPPLNQAEAPLLLYLTPAPCPLWHPMPAQALHHCTAPVQPQAHPQLSWPYHAALFCFLGQGQAPKAGGGRQSPGRDEGSSSWEGAQGLQCNSSQATCGTQFCHLDGTMLFYVMAQILPTVKK